MYHHCRAALLPLRGERHRAKFRKHFHRSLTRSSKVAATSSYDLFMKPYGQIAPARSANTVFFFSSRSTRTVRVLWISRESTVARERESAKRAKKRLTTNKNIVKNAVFYSQLFQIKNQIQSHGVLGFWGRNFGCFLR